MYINSEVVLIQRCEMIFFQMQIPNKMALVPPRPRFICTSVFFLHGDLQTGSRNTAPTIITFCVKYE